MTASAIFIIILLVVIIAGAIYIFLSRTQLKEIKNIEQKNKTLEKDIKTLHKKAKDVKNAKKATNINDLLTSFSALGRN